VHSAEPVDFDLDRPVGDRGASIGLQIHPVTSIRLRRFQRLPQSRIERRAFERVVTGGVNRLVLVMTISCSEW
jgi:hypothetical protein